MTCLKETHSTSITSIQSVSTALTLGTNYDTVAPKGELEIEASSDIDQIWLNITRVIN